MLLGPQFIDVDEIFLKDGIPFIESNYPQFVSLLYRFGYASLKIIKWIKLNKLIKHTACIKNKNI